jgi:hypothetical protein
MLRLEAIQSGQMVPVPKAWSFDSTQGDPVVEAELHRLLESCAFLHAEEPHAAAQPDRGSLSIAVETEHGSKRLTIPLGGAPAHLVPLIKFLEPRLAWRPRAAEGSPIA